MFQRKLLVCALALAASSSVALANGGGGAPASISDIALRIVAESGGKTAEWTLLRSDLQQKNPDGTQWGWNGTHVFTSSDGTALGSFTGGTNINIDPIIGMSIALVAPAVATHYTISSAVLGFTPGFYDANASAGFSLTDNDGNGALVTGGFPGNRLYEVLCNGAPLAFLLPGWPAGIFATTVNSDSFGPVGPINAFSMQSVMDLTLSANDLFSGTATYVKTPSIPAPASGLLLGLGGVIAGRRRR